MADVTEQTDFMEVFWTKEDSNSTGDSGVHVPGVTFSGNLRPGPVQGHRTKEVTAKIPNTQPMIEDWPVKKVLHRRTTSRDDSNSQNAKQASLKDLCIEDKKRVANLIQELAKVGQDKETAVDQVQKERLKYEAQIMQLVEHQEQIVREREDIQSQLFQCQNLLTKYQHEVLEQQEELNNSIREGYLPKMTTDPVERYVPGISDHNAEHYVFPDVQNVNNILSPHEQELVTNLREQAVHPGLFTEDAGYMQDPRISLQRPLTSLIDKDIVAERQDYLSHQQILHTPTNDVGTGQFYSSHQYPNFGPLNDPLLSSTQKSNEIRTFIDNHDDRDWQFSPQPFLNGALDDRNLQNFEADTGYMVRHRSQKGKPSVAFVTGDIVAQDRLASPQIHPSNDKFLEYYRKLTPSERKRELLVQRAALLEEQKRLQLVLDDQEIQLQEKKDQLHAQQRSQKRRLTYFENEGNFPADMQDSIHQEAAIEERLRILHHQVMTKPEQLLHDSPKQNGHVADASLSSSHRSPITKVTVGTSPIVSAEMDNYRSPVSVDQSINDIVRSPRLNDIVTNLSYRSPDRSSVSEISSRQGNIGARHPIDSLRSPEETFTSERPRSITELVDELEHRVKSLEGSYLDNKDPLAQHVILDSDENSSSKSVEENEEERLLEDLFFTNFTV